MAGTPQEVAARWQQRLSQSGEKIKAGVMAVQQSPGASAAAAADLWQQRVSSAEARAKFVAGTQRLSTGEWQQRMISKGIPRITGGAQDALVKVEQFLAQFLPHVQSVAARVRAMPKGGLENGIARAATQIRGNAQFRRSG